VFGFRRRPSVIFVSLFTRRAWALRSRAQNRKFSSSTAVTVSVASRLSRFHRTRVQCTRMLSSRSRLHFNC